jgi:hypothetical protein
MLLKSLIQISQKIYNKIKEYPLMDIFLALWSSLCTIYWVNQIFVIQKTLNPIYPLTWVIVWGITTFICSVWFWIKVYNFNKKK